MWIFTHTHTHTDTVGQTLGKLFCCLGWRRCLGGCIFWNNSKRIHFGPSPIRTSIFAPTPSAAGRSRAAPPSLSKKPKPLKATPLNGLSIFAHCPLPFHYRHHWRQRQHPSHMSLQLFRVLPGPPTEPHPTHHTNTAALTQKEGKHESESVRKKQQQVRFPYNIRTHFANMFVDDVLYKMPIKRPA